MIAIKMTPADQMKLKMFTKKSRVYVKALDLAIRNKIAQKFLKHLRKGLKENALNLIRLSPITIAKKRAQGLPSPGTPLYGRGRGKDRTIYELLEVRKSRRTTSVGFRPNKKHHSGVRIQQLILAHIQGREGLPKRDLLGNAIRKFNLTTAITKSLKFAEKKVKF